MPCSALLAPCADVVVSLVHCDDVVPRLCVETYARLLEELASPACEPAPGSLPPALQVVQHLGQLATKSKRERELEQHNASSPERESEGSGGLARLHSQEFASKAYHAHVPGRILFLHRLPEAGRTSIKLVDTRHPALRHIRLTSRMFEDHFIDREPFMKALEGAAAEDDGV